MYVDIFVKAFFKPFFLAALWLFFIVLLFNIPAYVSASALIIFICIAIYAWATEPPA